MHKQARTPITLLGGCALAALMACGGGGGTPVQPTPPANATRLHYTNNPGATSASWRLELDSGQDTSRLVLKLMAPAGLVAKGASVFLSCDGVRTSWVSASAGTAFDLGSGVQIFRAKAGATSADYQVGLYQKAGTATLGNNAVALLTLDLKSGVLPGSASVGVTSGKTGIILDGSAQNQPISGILAGELTAQ